MKKLKGVLPNNMATAIMNSLWNQTHQAYATTSIDQINVPRDLQHNIIKSTKGDR